MITLLVACLCAEWCDTCRDYRLEFDSLGKEFPQHRFVWFDIEEHGDQLGDIDVENFPTLLVASNEKVLFAGTMLPQINRLRRLLLSAQADGNEQNGALPPDQMEAYRNLAISLQENTR
jgi:thioredoxin 1